MVFISMHPMPSAGAPGYAAAAAWGVFSSFLCGLAAPVLWTVQSVYVGRCAFHAACSEQQDMAEGDDLRRAQSFSGTAVARMASAFNGVFFSVFQFSGFVGSTTSSLILLVDKNGASRMVLSLILGAISLTGSLSTLALPKVPP